MKKIPCLLLILMLGCKKNPPEPRPITPVIAPLITVSQIMDGCAVRDNSNVPRPVDSTILQSSFTLYRLSDQNQYWPIDIRFGLVINRGDLNAVSWTIGKDPLQRTSPAFSLTFNDPVGKIQVQAVVQWTPISTAGVRTDTITTELNIQENSFVPGTYRGADTENPTKIFEVTVGKLTESKYDTFAFWGISNLPEGFPVNLPVFMYSHGFGFCTAPFPYPERYNFNNKYFSQPFGLGFLSSTNTDSLIINYSYVEYENSFSLNNIKSFTKTFKGKRI